GGRGGRRGPGGGGAGGPGQGDGRKRPSRYPDPPSRTGDKSYPNKPSRIGDKSYGDKPSRTAGGKWGKPGRIMPTRTATAVPPTRTPKPSFNRGMIYNRGMAMGPRPMMFRAGGFSFGPRF